MNRYLVIACLLYCLLVSTSCRHEPLVSLDTACPEMYLNRSTPINTPFVGALPDCPSSYQFLYPDPYLYTFPCVCPDNEYLICYLRRDPYSQSELTHDLFTFNFCTGESNLIAQNVAYGPDWGSSGWITFTGTDYQIWKVRENGDSLIRLTNTGDYCNYAKWSPNGQLILYKDAASGTMKVIDANGNLILERHINIPVWYWYSDNEIMTTDQFISTSTTNFVLFNLYDSLFTTLHSVTGFGLWHFNQYSFRHKKAIVVNTIPPFYQQNVYVIDINSFHLDSLRNAESQSFSKGHEVFLKDHIICYRDCRDTTDDDCVLKVQQYLSIMDADGSNERRILLPE